MSDPSNNTGFKPFNSTGRDDSTTEIIKPKGDGQRRMIFAGIVLALIIGLCWFGFARTGLNPWASSEEESHGFGQRPKADIGSAPRDE
jgi:hypothetical protein